MKGGTRSEGVRSPRQAPRMGAAPQRVQSGSVSQVVPGQTVGRVRESRSGRGMVDGGRMLDAVEARIPARPRMVRGGDLTRSTMILGQRRVVEGIGER